MGIPAGKQPAVLKSARPVLEGLSKAPIIDKNVCTSRGCGNDPEHGKTVTG